MRHSFSIRIGIAALVVVTAIGCSGGNSGANSSATSSTAETKPAANTNSSPARAARMAVKGVTDADGAKIDKAPKDISVEELSKNKPNGDLSTRQAPFESTVWRVTATIESIETKKDGDYYMVLRGEKGGQTVVEVPDPKTVKGSAFEGEIAATRKALEEKYHPTSDKKTVNEKATITGVGFLGFSSKPKKGSTGYSGARLLPGTDIKFDDGKKS